MIDSETEPALMMEPVLEDVVIPDGHSHNLVSTSSRSVHGGFAFSNRSVRSADNVNLSSLQSYLSPFNLVEQVMQVDEIITRLLKVLRIVLMENDQLANEV